MKKTKSLKLLFCVNDRGAGRVSCAGSGANALRKHAKALAAEHDAINIKVKKSGCLGHCKHGPVIEILPIKAIYRCTSKDEIDLLFTQQIDRGETVKPLLIKAGKSKRAGRKA